MSRRRVCPLLALTLALAVPVAAHDRYESDLGLSFPDDTFATYVELLHGQVQSHDLEATTPADQDWTFVQEALRHSYEVTVMNTALRFASAPTAGFATMNRVDELGKILTPGAVTNAFDGVFSARWIVTSPQPFGYSYVRVEGFESLGPDSGYDIQVKDTTYSLPRWNNNGTQVTVFLLQNTTDRTVNGSLYFYDPAGANIHTHPLQLDPTSW
jgi:hypothetical protein